MILVESSPHFEKKTLLKMHFFLSLAMPMKTYILPWA